jgi:hypothetical protein
LGRVLRCRALAAADGIDPFAVKLAIASGTFGVGQGAVGEKQRSAHAVTFTASAWMPSLYLM